MMRIQQNFYNPIYYLLQLCFSYFNGQCVSDFIFGIETIVQYLKAPGVFYQNPYASKVSKKYTSYFIIFFLVTNLFYINFPVTPERKMEVTEFLRINIQLFVQRTTCETQLCVQRFYFFFLFSYFNSVWLLEVKLVQPRYLQSESFYTPKLRKVPLVLQLSCEIRKGQFQNIVSSLFLPQISNQLSTNDYFKLSRPARVKYINFLQSYLIFIYFNLFNAKSSYSPSPKSSPFTDISSTIEQFQF